MKTMKKSIVKCGTALASLALKVGVSTNKQACIFWYNQPKEPKGISKFRKP
ncbi:cyclic lactone autoinducer peptide [uncultured Ruminococcus sp.]|jgi:cyclic lactone autoinducer peptide|uniref:cyclic lactone autoinducer peptide n=1 Tax=uncultured Ruminococcus sp. TaxID=165186 RepID=UPI0025D51D65|nr:cyclic lactone autoinducer peptide [uncultured Ruminococcus sp.]